MKVLIDTNVLLDFYCQREDFYLILQKIHEKISKIRKNTYICKKIIIMPEISSIFTPFVCTTTSCAEYEGGINRFLKNVAARPVQTFGGGNLVYIPTHNFFRTL